MEKQQQAVRELFGMLAKRSDRVCNFLEIDEGIWGPDTRIVYRHYATLYIVFVVDGSESELGILDLIQVSCCKIFLWHLLFQLVVHSVYTRRMNSFPTRPPPIPPQVFVESLDRSFQNVCELHLIFHSDQVIFLCRLTLFIFGF